MCCTSLPKLYNAIDGVGSMKATIVMCDLLLLSWASHILANIMIVLFHTCLKHCSQARQYLVSFPDRPPKRKGEFLIFSHYGLAVAIDSSKSHAFEVSCRASVNWRCAK